MPAKPSQSDAFVFEDAMQRLDDIVTAMENNELSLDDLVKRYEEGAGLLRHCRSHLDTARQRVELITAQLDAQTQGTATLEPFAADAAPESAADPALKSRSAPAQGQPRRKPAPDDDSDDIRLF